MATQASPAARKVLVIDDSQTVRLSAERFLHEAGHKVQLAEDGFEALARLPEFLPDLVFCDIQMPRINGYQVCAIMKRSSDFADVPVVMLSSSDSVFDMARGRLVGAEQHLVKPFTKEQLLAALQQYASASRA